MRLQLPSTQGERADHILNEARDLVVSRDQESPIREGDLRVMKERIIFAKEIKIGMDTKSGIRRFIHTREYYKFAKEAYRYAKHISRADRVDPDRYRLRFRTPRSLYRCWLSCKDAFPPSVMQDKWVLDAWNEARFRPDAKDKQFKCSSMKLLNGIKTKTNSVVESLYEFKSSQDPQSIIRNASRAQALLAETTFIYHELNFGGRPRFPYRHPIIQEVVNLTWFQNEYDIGIIFHEYFAPIPFEAIALVLTVIECCIDEWSTGSRQESSWKEVHYNAVYLSHLNSLRDIHNRDPHQKGRDLLRQIQDDLLVAASMHAGDPLDPTTERGRLSMHARAPPDPTTERGRLSIHALDAAIHDVYPEYDSNQSQRSLVNSGI